MRRTLAMALILSLLLAAMAATAEGAAPGCFYPDQVVEAFNRNLRDMFARAFDDVSDDEIDTYVNFYHLSYDETLDQIAFYNSEDLSLELAVYYKSGTVDFSRPADTLSLTIIGEMPLDLRRFFEYAYAFGLWDAEPSLDGEALINFLGDCGDMSGQPLRQLDLGGFTMTRLNVQGNEVYMLTRDDA